MFEPVIYERAGSAAVITLDDGKANAMSPAMQGAIHAALDRATADDAVVVLTGRSGIMSGGFDLVTLQSGGGAAVDMVQGGFELSLRLLEFPRPVIVACTGHAIAMGAFLLLSADYRIGASGDYRVTANEVSIGLTMPFAATEILRQRLTPAAFNHATTLSTVFDPDEAVAAGFLDRLVAPEAVRSTALELAELAALLPAEHHRESKRRARDAACQAIRDGIDADRAALSA